MKTAFRRTVLTALLLAALPAAQAAVQNYSFNGVLDSGALIGQSYSGSFSYDDTAFTGIDTEWLSVTTLSMSFMNTNYTLANANALAPTEVGYYNGTFLGLSYSVDSSFPKFSLIAGYEDVSQAYLAYDPAAGLSGFGSVVYAPVPEPETYALLLAGLGLLGAVSRRRAKAA